MNFTRSPYQSHANFSYIISNKKKSNYKLLLLCQNICVTSLTPCPLLRFVTDTWESPPSALYTENMLLPSGCQAISSGHLLCLEVQSVALSKEAPDLQIKDGGRQKMGIR